MYKESYGFVRWILFIGAIYLIAGIVKAASAVKPSLLVQEVWQAAFPNSLGEFLLGLQGAFLFAAIVLAAGVALDIWWEGLKS